MNKQILLPHGVKNKLYNEFAVARPTLDKMLLGASVRDEKTKGEVRARAIQLGGAYVVNN